MPAVAVNGLETQAYSLEKEESFPARIRLRRTINGGGHFWRVRMGKLMPVLFAWVGIFTAAYCFGGINGLGVAGALLAFVQIGTK